MSLSAGDKLGTSAGANAEAAAADAFIRLGSGAETRHVARTLIRLALTSAPPSSCDLLIGGKFG